jgi:glyoxylase-like metal-dependent hydrolase (beta-lactamase superfamily II)
MLRVRAVLGNCQRLDGGAMFGNAPRALWSRWLQPDERGCVRLAGRALLVQDGRHRVLLETGVGACFEPKLRARYGVDGEQNRLLTSLAAIGVAEEQIDVVVLSHLHFDHAGGLLTAYQPGERLRLLFPGARYVTSRAAFARASEPHPRDRASFIPELPTLLRESGRLVLIDGAERPKDLLDSRYQFTWSDGHTPGMLHARIEGEAQSICSCADLVPGVPWLRLAITMGYDRYAERVVDEKRELLAAAAAQGTWLFFTHDVQIALARVEQDAQGQFATVESLTDAEVDLDLDVPA